MATYKKDLRFCGSAHCRRKVHRWIYVGTPHAMLSSENCGAQPDRSDEELRASEKRRRQWSVDLYARLERENKNA
jgi:hypothetical protein